MEEGEFEREGRAGGGFVRSCSNGPDSRREETVVEVVSSSRGVSAS
jgi:hypothetical protein